MRVSSRPGSGGSAFSPGPLLSGPGGNNNDTTVGAPVAGRMIYANGTPLWTFLAPASIQYFVLQVRDAAGVVPSWAFVDGNNFGTFTANKVFASLSAPGIGSPSFRALVNGDLPTVNEAHGGTDQTTYATGDMLYSDAADNLTKLTIGGGGTVLTAVGGVPVWQTPVVASVGLGLTISSNVLTRTAAVQALTDAATIATDASLSPKDFGIATVTLGGNRTLGNPTNPTDGQRIMYQVKQDGTGSRTLAYDTKFLFSTTVPSPTLTTAANSVDILLFQYNATADKWRALSTNLGFTS